MSGMLGAASHTLRRSMTSMRYRMRCVAAWHPCGIACRASLHGIHAALQLQQRCIVSAPGAAA
eukprot:365853-Chlamydomonas_euryale.AAC.3